MKKIWMFIIKIAIAVLIISYLIHTHYQSFTEGIRNFNIIWLLPALLLLYIEMTACAFRWYYLLKTVNIKLSWSRALSLTMRGYFCSLILPGGAIGGDAAKIGMILHTEQKGERFEPSLSILIDRIIGMLALFSLAIILIAADFKTLLKADLSKIGIPNDLNLYIILLIILLCLAGIIAAIVLFSYRIIEKVPVFKFLIDKFNTLTRGLVNRMKLAIDMYLIHWRSLLLLTAGSVLFVHLIQLPILCCICYGLNITIPSYLTLATALITGNIAGLIPLTPGGIGLRDITIYTILAAGGFSDVTLIPLLLSLVLVIGNVSVGIFFFDKSTSQKTEKNFSKDTCKI